MVNSKSIKKKIIILNDNYYMINVVTWKFHSKCINFLIYCIPNKSEKMYDENFFDVHASVLQGLLSASAVVY